MRRTCLVLLALCLLLSLCACGGKTESISSEQNSAVSAEPVTVETVGDYIVPDHWTETSINDGTYAYVTEESEERVLSSDGIGHRYRVDNDLEKQSITIEVFREDGTALYTVEIPYLEPVEDQQWENDYTGRYVFLEDSLWASHEHSSYDPETETGIHTGYLEHWDAEGNRLAAIPYSEYGLDDDNNFFNDITLGENDRMLLLTQKEILLLDMEGAATARRDIPEDNWLEICRDSSGRCYFYENLTTNSLYTVDWENCDLGKQLFEADFSTRVRPGGGEYDFLTYNDSILSGVSLETGTITEILHWTDYDLAGSIGAVEYVDGETFRVSVASFMSDSECLYLRRVPAGEVPEKTSVYMAVPLMYWEDMPDRTWTESLDQMITEQMNSFNRRNPNYRIEVVTFGSASDLQMLMQSDTPPDLICWDGDGLEEPPSAQIYGAKGYLTDLEPLVEADPELSMSDFIPRCVELIQGTYGGFYLFPREFYGRTLVARGEYVGNEKGWSMEEFCQVAKNLPEGMTIWGGDGKTLLRTLLETGMEAFVDYAAGTCDFENQTFLDLLTVCRDKCGTEENWEEGLGNNLMKVEAVMGRFGNFAIETMIPAREEGLTLIGYPGAGGNGMNLTFSGRVSITTLGSHPDVAWDFVRELMSYDFQKNSYGFASIREDVFNEKEDKFAEMHSEEATEADFAAARALPYDAGCSTVYDSPASQIVMEEVEAFFAGDKSAEETARIIQNRVRIYLGEQF